MPIIGQRKEGLCLKMAINDTTTTPENPLDYLQIATKEILKGTIITQRARLNQIASRMHKMTVKTRPTLTKNFIPF